MAARLDARLKSLNQVAPKREGERKGEREKERETRGLANNNVRGGMRHQDVERHAAEIEIRETGPRFSGIIASPPTQAQDSTSHGSWSIPRMQGWSPDPLSVSPSASQSLEVGSASWPMGENCDQPMLLHATTPAASATPKLARRLSSQQPRHIGGEHGGFGWRGHAVTLVRDKGCGARKRRVWCLLMACVCCEPCCSLHHLAHAPSKRRNKSVAVAQSFRLSA